MLAEIHKLEAAGDTQNPRYMELLIPHHYEKHLLRMADLSKVSSPQGHIPQNVSLTGGHLKPMRYAGFP